MNSARRIAKAARWALCLAGMGAGLAASRAEEPELRVGLREDPPFSTKADGHWSGLSVDLWTVVGKQVGVKPVWVDVLGDEAPTLLAAGKIEVGPAAAISARRLGETPHFSPPFLASGVGIATTETQGWRFRKMLRNLWQSDLLSLIGIIVAANLVIGFVLWRLERKHRPEALVGTDIQGFGSAVWCALTTMTTVGYGDKVPVTWAGRALCFVIMVSGLGVTSLLTAAIASAITVETLKPRVHTPEDLRHVVSAAIRRTPGERYLRDNGMRMVVVEDPAAAAAALESGKAADIVHGRVELRAWYRSHPAQVAILPLNLQEIYYAYPLAPASDAGNRLSGALQQFMETDGWLRVQQAYLTD